jgi:hypothetical protein
MIKLIKDKTKGRWIQVTGSSKDRAWEQVIAVTEEEVISLGNQITKLSIDGMRCPKCLEKLEKVDKYTFRCKYHPKALIFSKYLAF